MPQSTPIQFSVFTKPWRMPLPELGRHVRGLGFTGVELPVRPGFQVEPGRVARGLPAAGRLLADFGLTITSVAGPTDEATIAACAEAGVPLLRIMIPIGDEGYLATEARALRELEALVPLLERYGVKVGIQNHCDRFVPHALGLRRLFERFDPAHIGAVWDAAHNALNGEGPELAIEIVWSHLALVNLKNALWRREPGPEDAPARWGVSWTTGRQGLASWPRVAAELIRRGYAGGVCLTAEYDDESAVDCLVAEDLAFARSLFAEARP
ncbi:MAG: sugar phosphate isomerase/epimerase [Armatimonadetes bacterium]|nr:sugar phosphate isomerase/epimerase [Armatimonadota bacterium]